MPDRLSIPFPDTGQAFMRYVENFRLRLLRGVERDGRSSRSLFMKPIGMYLELDVGKLEDFIDFGLIVNTSDLNISDMISVLESV